MKFTEALIQRHSVRAFKPTPVSDDLVDLLLRRALTSPSWSNTQPYRIAVASGDLRQRLAAAFTAKYEKVRRLQRKPVWQQALMGILQRSLPDGDFKPILKYPAELQARRAETGFGLYKHLGIERSDHEARDLQMARNFEFFDAPTVLFVFVHEGLGVYSALDAGIFLQSLMLAATDEGLGTCAQGALALWRSPLDEVFNIPEKYKLICGLALGYPSDSPVNEFRPGRRSVEDIKVPLIKRNPAL